MWISRLLIGSVFLLTRSQCQNQKTVCNIDPDLVYFDDEGLERLKNSFQAGGDCSPIDLKGELETSLQTRGKQIRDLSNRDRSMLEYLRSFDQRPSSGGHFYPGNQRTTGRPAQGDIPLDNWRTPSSQSNRFIDARDSNPNQQNPQISRLIRPSWNQILDDSFNAITNSKNSLFQENLRPKTPQQALFTSTGNRFNVLTNNQRFPPKPSNELFRPTPQLIRPSFSDQGGPQDNEIVMPDSVTETTSMPGPPTWATPPSPCVRRCPNTPEYNPVCGTDKVSYMNPGRLRCERQCGKGVSINHYGNCVLTTADPLIVTTPLSAPARSPSRFRSSSSILFRD